MKLITLNEAKDHLRVDSSDSDDDINAIIEAASGAVLNYLKGAPIADPKRDDDGSIVRDQNGDIEYRTDEEDALIVRPEIVAATKLLVGTLFANRENDDSFDVGMLPRAVVALLYPLRDPALA